MPVQQLHAGSSVKDILDVLMQNADYEVDNNLAKCKLFLRAALRLQLINAEEWEHDGSRMEIDWRKLQQAIDDARKYIAINDANSTANVGRVLDISFETFRDR